MAFANITAAWEAYPPKRVPVDTEWAQGTGVVKNAVTIYKGSAVVEEYSGSAHTGYLVYADDGSASDTFVGVAAETVVGDGSKKIRVWKKGLFPFKKSSPSIADVGVTFYIDDASDPITVDSAGNLAIGVCEEVDSDAGVVWLRIDGFAK